MACCIVANPQSSSLHMGTEVKCAVQYWMLHYPAVIKSSVSITSFNVFYFVTLVVSKNSPFSLEGSIISLLMLT